MQPIQVTPLEFSKRQNSGIGSQVAKDREGEAPAFEVALFESENAKCVGNTREYQPRKGDMQ
jgi:hypothetical protein